MDNDFYQGEAFHCEKLRRLSAAERLDNEVWDASRRTRDQAIDEAYAAGISPTYISRWTGRSHQTIMRVLAHAEAARQSGNELTSR